MVYLYDGWQVVEEREPDGESWEARSQFIYGGTYIDEPLIFDKDTDSDGDCVDAGGSSRFFYAQQANFNVVAVTASDGTVVETVTYDPYGEATVTVAGGQSASGSPYLFQGRRWDGEADLYYFRNRPLSPRLGRFVQRDPIGYVDGLNLYEGLAGNPQSYIDPYGLYGLDIHFYMTYYLARECGFGDPSSWKHKGKGRSQAYVIAWADQFTDDHPATGPWNADACGKWHFRMSTGQELINEQLDRDGVLRKGHIQAMTLSGSSAAKRPLEKAITKKDIMAFGAGLHAFQDSWAHDRCTEMIGHVHKGHRPDWPWDRPDHALEMAKRTYEMLDKLMCKLEGKHCEREWKTISPDIKRLIKQANSKKTSDRARVWRKWIKNKLRLAGLGYGDPGEDHPWAKGFLKSARSIVKGE